LCTDQVDIVARRVEHRVPSINETTVAKLVQTDEQNAQRAEDQHRRLQHGSIHDDAHAAENRVKTGGERQTGRDSPEHVYMVPEEVNVVHVQQGADDDVASVDR